MSIKASTWSRNDHRDCNEMDQGARRSNADQLAIHKVLNATVVTTVAAAWTGWHEGRWTTSASSLGSPVLTHSETLEFVKTHPEVVPAAQMAKATSKFLRLHAGVIGAAYMIMTTIYETDAETFFQKIRDGETTGKGDPLVALMRKAQFDRDKRRKSTPGLSFYLIFRAWNAWRKKEPLDRLRTHANGVDLTPSRRTAGSDGRSPGFMPTD